MRLFFVIIIVTSMFLVACGSTEVGTPPVQNAQSASAESTPTVDQLIETHDWGEIRWKLKQGEKIPLGALAIGTLPATQLDGPVLPIADLVVGGVILSVWIYNGGPQDAAAAVVQGYNGLVIYGRSVAVEASLGEVVDYDNFLNGPMMTTRHEESAWIIQNLHQMAKDGTLRTNNPDGCRTGVMGAGTVCVYAATPKIYPKNGELFEGHIAALVIKSTNMGTNPIFVVANGQMRMGLPPAGETGWTHLGDGLYADFSSFYWKCAWFMAQQSNGKSTQPNLWLDVGSGWQRWLQIQSQYGLTMLIKGFKMPPVLDQVITWKLDMVKPWSK